MHDIHPSLEQLDRRPSKAMPQKVQEMNRDPSVDLRRPSHDGRRQAVFPGTRKQGERVGVLQARGECGGEPMDVLPDAGPLAERRSVVDEDVHSGRIVAHQKSGKPLSFNRLTVFFWLCYL